MKKLKKIYWMLLIVLCAACNDPYDGDTFVVFDTQPAATYLSSRSEDFSEWIHIMKYADLYNAVNQATLHSFRPQQYGRTGVLHPKRGFFH